MTKRGDFTAENPSIFACQTTPIRQRDRPGLFLRRCAENLERIQRTTDELHQAVSDIVGRVRQQ